MAIGKNLLTELQGIAATAGVNSNAITHSNGIYCRLEARSSKFSNNFTVIAVLEVQNMRVRDMIQLFNNIFY